MSDIDSIMAMMADGVKLGDGWVIDSREYIEERDEMTDYSKMLPESYPVLQKNSATYDEEKKLLSEKRIVAEMSEELKPCPFCGSTKYVGKDWINPNGEEPCEIDELYESAWCEICGVSMMQDWNDWNARPIEDAIRARAERAEQMVEKLIEAGSVLIETFQDFPDFEEYPEVGNWDTLVDEWKEREK